MRSGSAARRRSWALADQAVSSLTNFALSVAVARAVGVRAFGAFGLAVGLYLFLVGLSRAVLSEPLLVRFSDTDDVAWRKAVQQSVGVAVLLGVGLGIPCAAAGAVLPGPVGAALVPLGLTLPGLLAQDAWRFAFLARGRPAAATANDAAWAVAQAALMGGVLAAGGSVGPLVAAWGVSAAVAAVTGAVQAGTVPALGGARAWFAGQGDLAVRFAGEFLLRQGGRQLTVYAVGGAGGLPALAAIRGAQVVYGPLHVLLAAVQLIGVPEAVRLARRSPLVMAAEVRKAAAGLAALGILAGVASVLLPERLGVALLGDTWSAAEPVLVPQALVMAGVGVSAAYLAGLRALAEAGRTLRARVVTLPLYVAGGAGGAAAFGPAGAIGGIAVAQAVGSVVLARELSAAVGEAVRPAAGTRPHASATVAGSVTVTEAGIRSTAARKSARQ